MLLSTQTIDFNEMVLVSLLKSWCYYYPSTLSGHLFSRVNNCVMFQYILNEHCQSGNQTFIPLHCGLSTTVTSFSKMISMCVDTLKGIHHHHIYAGLWCTQKIAITTLLLHGSSLDIFLRNSCVPRHFFNVVYQWQDIFLNIWQRNRRKKYRFIHLPCTTVLRDCENYIYAQFICKCFYKIKLKYKWRLENYWWIRKRN